MAAPYHRPIHPTLSDFTTSQSPNENTNTLDNLCIPSPLIHPLRLMTTLAFPLSFKIYPRPQWISMASFRRDTSKGRPKTPTNSASDAVRSPPPNYQGFLYTNSSNTGTKWLRKKLSSPDTAWSPLFCNHTAHGIIPALRLCLLSLSYSTDLRSSLRRHTKITRIETHG